jgi:AcrR family transcriptional regulator
MRDASPRRAEPKGGGARGEKTRQQLLAAGARLIALRGIKGVTSREIVKAAGQRNTGALQYYFGSTKGLLEQIVRIHRDRLSARRDELLEAVEREGRTDDLRSLIEVLFRPLGELVDRAPEDRAYVQIAAQLMSDPELSFEEFLAMVHDPVSDRVNGHLLEIALGLPHALLIERFTLAVVQTTQAVAYHARREETPPGKRQRISTELFIENLIDMTVAGLTAPVSPKTAALIATDA